MPCYFPLMIFAAGFGTRMRGLTADRPKPLIPVAGRPLIDRALDLADAARAAPIVVNIHYLGDQIETHLADRPGIRISDESDAILETGGGLRRALPLLGAGPVMTLNPDAIWLGANPLSLLADHWDASRMEALLLVKDRIGLPGRSGTADFRVGPDGAIQRANGPDGVVYLGAQILDPSEITAITDEAFSLNLLWDRIIAKGRAYALYYPGGWCDVGSPEGLAEAESLLRGQGDV